mmetsp:Transcript_43251/g.85305  ORF Transcript_43251/g.85305 Transcript_43251/m.85305 type:complete len:220 (-) Transcript_43251:665-1324(-)
MHRPHRFLVVKLESLQTPHRPGHFVVVRVSREIEVHAVFQEEGLDSPPAEKHAISNSLCLSITFPIFRLCAVHSPVAYHHHPRRLCPVGPSEFLIHPPPLLFQVPHRAQINPHIGVNHHNLHQTQTKTIPPSVTGSTGFCQCPLPPCQSPYILYIRVLASSLVVPVPPQHRGRGRIALSGLQERVPDPCAVVLHVVRRVTEVHHRRVLSLPGRVHECRH